MRRGVFVSSLLIAGSALCAPAYAQAQDAQVQDRPPEVSAARGEALLARAEALTAKVEAPAPKVEAPVAKAQAPAAKPAKPAKPEPLLAVPNGQVMDRAREIAEADLAAAPDEEVKPLRVDPNLARKRTFALPKPTPQPAAEAKPVLAEREREAPPEVAEARAEPKRAIEAEAKPVLAAAERSEEPALAEHDAKSEPLRGGGDPVVKPAYAQRRYEAADEAEHGDPVVRPTYRQRRWEPKPVEQAERVPAAEPRAVSDGRPDYVEAERIVREVNARAEGAPLPAAESGRMAAAAPAEPVAAEASARVAETAAPVARAAPAAEPVQVADAAEEAGGASEVAEVAGEAGDGGREVLRDAARAARVVRQAGRVARVLGGAAVGAAADAPVYAGEERDEREAAPVYAEEDERGEEPVYADDAREERREPVYEERREAPVYAEQRREPVYEARREAPVYAEDERAYPPVYERPIRPRFGGYRYGERYASREVSGYCDNQRYEGLARAVRRAVEVGSIDWRTARDMEDEIASGEDMQRSYCASGLNGWRAQRLDAQYSQIEDRLRFERGRYR